MSRKLNLKKGQKVVVRYINDKLRGIPDKSINGIDRWTTSGEVTKEELRERTNIIKKFKAEVEKAYLKHEKII